jgi:ankyrin repeat protein
VLIFIELGLRPNPVADQIFTSTNSLFHRPSLADSQDNSLALEKRVEVISSLLSGSVDVKTTSSFVATIQSLLPERYSGEIDEKLQILKESSSICSPAQIAELAVYLISNNVISDYKLDTFVKWLTQEIPEGVLRGILNSKTLTIQAFKQKLLEKAASIGEETFRILVETEPEKSYLTGPIGQRCLQIAASREEIEVVRILLDLGVSPDSVTSTDEDDYDFNLPPLHHAASNLDYDMLTLLINAGADVNSPGLAPSDTPLSRAIDDITFSLDEGLKFSYDCIHALIEAGANVDYFGMEQALLDRAYLVDDKLYRILLASSKAAKTELTVSGILDAAMHGIQALSEYLDDRKKFRPRKALELSLFRAIPSHSAALMTLLEFGVDPDGPSSKECPLIKAISQGRIDLVSTLLGYNANINLPRVLSTSALSPDLLPILDFLIKQGADIRRFGGVALRKALDKNNLPAVKLLLISGVDINSWIPGHGTPICIAAAKCGVRTVEYLVKAGAEVNAGNHRKTGRTALLKALEFQKWTTAKFLLQHGADAQINTSGRTLLEASLGSRTNISPEGEEMFEILLNRGAQINGPLKRRLCADWNSALTLLIQKGAKEKTIQLALDAGADVNQAGSGSGSRTPIQAAASEGNLAMVKKLHSRGADINAPAGTIYGRTALQAACCLSMPNLELVRFLLDNDADVNAQPGIKQGLTALQGAAIQGHIKVATLLLDRGAEVNGDVAEAEGRTALDGAAEHGRLDMVQFLLNVGAQSEVPGTTGYDRAIALANENRHFAVADLLRSQGRSL